MTKLSLSDWANVAEICASAGVIISLIFVGLQLQSNTIATEAATRDAVNQNDLAYLSLRLDSSVLARAHAKLENDEELTPLEESQLVHQEYVNFVSFEHSFYQYRKGNLEQDQWMRHRKIVQLLMESSPYSQAVWAGKHYEFGPHFQTLVDSFVPD